ncbi:hypothetical protein [Azospirillum doebereinerae]|uniref:DUF305 domain-containing protein n=1 Tax=Azospirillum doebereinerae TaxID=92933 RepID=A0A433JCA7_9PROT|nr:hypothetical protein [Azospirillum doebereinerae]RUQ74238.1 hypothetical protein EJ913_07770 [Azospirillum doebereinerae]
MRAGPTPTRRTGCRAALAAGVFMLAALPAAAQQTCGAMVEQFAADQSLSNQPPPTAVPAPPGSAGSTANGGTTGSGAASSERLAQSGGLITPPAVGDQAVIDPPRAGASNMPTAPAVRPDTRTDTPPSAGSTGDLMGQAARNAQLESLVTAARAAAKDGDEARCLEGLSEARRLSRTAPGGSGG